MLENADRNCLFLSRSHDRNKGKTWKVSKGLSMRKIHSNMQPTLLNSKFLHKKRPHLVLVNIPVPAQLKKNVLKNFLYIYTCITFYCKQACSCQLCIKGKQKRYLYEVFLKIAFLLFLFPLNMVQNNVFAWTRCVLVKMVTLRSWCSI